MRQFFAKAFADWSPAKVAAGAMSAVYSSSLCLGLLDDGRGRDEDRVDP